VQIDYLYDTLVEASREPWLQVQVLAAGALGLFALMTLLSLRKPSPRAATVGAAEVPVGVAPAAAATGSASAPVTVEPDGAVALREELEVAGDHLVLTEEASHDLETRLKKTQEDVSEPDDEPAPGMQEQIAAVERDRDSAEARAELAERRLGEMQRRLERLSRHPSAPPSSRGSERVGATATDEDAPVDAATELRARLARTAARNKPGPNVSN
jgi:hypothetical protein